ncbi:amidohydrolase family protein [Methanohalobium sp.]|uniref:amidohydrolase family protein n=1 Tax=Methanohalobium sp. TaxID=2837493 RepID=UPI0025E0B227|nr:amidohydrolase family protein [Methanohalobium sp.]
MSGEQVISGTILAGDELELIDGYICIKEGVIKEIGEEKRETDNIIAPCFVNAHTHIGDSVFKDPPLGRYRGYRLERDLDLLVKPPDGLKHQILHRTSYNKLVESMKSSIKDMINTGTGAFADFRESGVTGIQALKEAIDDTNIDNIILGRPTDTEGPESNAISEIDRILKNTKGLGISGVNDMDMKLLEKISDYTRKNKGLFAIHAGEKQRSDISEALSLKPDLMVHLTHANRQDLKDVSDENIPVVACPRSNFTTGVGMPPVADMLEEEINVAIGTDNVMLNSVNMFAEMETLSKLFGIEDRQVFKMCTLKGATALGLEKTGSIQEGNLASLMVLNGKSNNLSNINNPVSGIVRRGRPDDILSIIRA